MHDCLSAIQKMKGVLISQKTEELPDGNIYVEELYEIDQ